MLIFCSKCGKENKPDSMLCAGCKSFLFKGFLPPGEILKDRYKILALITHGGMGAVYKGTDIKTGEFVAIKELLPPFGDFEKQTKTLLWFKREAKILSSLKHPNLPVVVDFFFVNARYYLIMDLIEGEDLERKLNREGNPGLAEEKVLDWSIQILTVLDYIHNLDPPVLYRDLKPGNIMVNNQGRAILIDFGLARVVQAKGRIQTIIGTNGYIPLEQLQGKAEPRSDIYALGATMHHLLTGIIPKAFFFEFESIKKINPSVSDKTEKVVMKALENSKGKRFSTAKEMQDALC